MTQRFFAGGIATETNVFSPLPTGLDDYAVARAADSEETRGRVLGGSTMARYAAAVAAHGGDFVQGLYGFAMPAGLTSRRAYETLRAELLAGLEAALPVDGVLLTLHGAMVADGYEDCETDLARRVRSIVGREAKVAVLLDLHCDIPESLLAEADLVVTYKEYPHVDIDERAEELAGLLLDAVDGRTRPATAFFDCRMVGLYPTTREPMRSFVDRLKEAEARPGVLSVSLGHGFPWGDSAAMAARVVAIADGDAALAEAVAAELGREFFALRDGVTLLPLPLGEALDHALAVSGAGGPVVVADVADNAGGGAPGDATFVLRELLERRLENVGAALFWDPIAVQQAFAAGEGAQLTLRLGGKMGPASGDPLDLTVEVRGLVENLIQHWPQVDGAIEVPCGRSAWLRCAGIDVIVASGRQQVSLGRDVFTAFGIDPAGHRLLVVKSANHFHAAFAPIASEIVYMGAPGALTFDPREIPYRHLEPDKYPWLDDPWAER